MLKTQKNLDLEEIRKGFEMFDIDQTGKISPSELLETFDAMNLKNKNPFIYNLISSLSADNEEVSIDELISYVDEKLSDSQSQEGLNLIFDSLCEPNEDTLTLSTLPHIAKISEDNISEKELRYLIERAQMGGEEINFNDFCQIVKENNDNEEGKNGMSGNSKYEERGSQPPQQIYRKKASNKIPNENNKMNNINKKNIRNENIVKNVEDKRNNIYDIDDISEKKSKRNQRISSNKNNNIIIKSNDNDIKKNNRDNTLKGVNKVEKEENNILDNKTPNKNNNIKKKDEDEDENDDEDDKKKENGNIIQSANKESENEEDENGMESVNQSINQSINKFLEKKLKMKVLKIKKYLKI